MPWTICVCTFVCAYSYKKTYTYILSEHSRPSQNSYNTKDRQRIASALLDADGDTHQASIALLEDMIQHRAKKFGDAKQDLQSRKSDLEKTLAMIRVRSCITLSSMFNPPFLLAP